jgi:hypothetical protein
MENQLTRSIDRAALLMNTPKSYEDYVLLKIIAEPGFCWCFHCWPSVWGDINRHIAPKQIVDEGDVLLQFEENQLVLECHESGPEIVVYLGLLSVSLSLVKTIVDLIMIFAKSSDKDSQKRCDHLKITKYRMIDNKPIEQELIVLELPLNPDIEPKISGIIRQSLDANNQDCKKIFCNMIRKRSHDNRAALLSMGPDTAVSVAISILRIELDSMIRVIYLLSIPDLDERTRLIYSVLCGKGWLIKTAKGKWKKITDKEMVDLSQRLQGWTQSVYKFGCAFIHLSDYHNNQNPFPFSRLPEAEKQAILFHMRHYHEGPLTDNPSMQELSMFIPGIFGKISSNLEVYLAQLENDE